MPRKVVSSFVAVLALVAGLAGAVAPAASAAPISPHADAVRLCDAPAHPGRMQCMALVRTDVAHRRGLAPSPPSYGYGPADIASAYDLPSDAGAGATVAIIDAFDDPTAEADLAVYREQFGLPACTSADGCLRKIDQRGGTSYPQPDPGWAGEISLDLDAVSATCPACHILLVEAESNSGADLAAAVDQAVAQGAKYVSNSYGGPDDPSEADLDRHYDHPGVAITASSGDFGYGVEYPAASPYVTSVGGTSLTRDDSARGWAEQVWHNYTGAPGSGCSATEIKPSYQHDDGCANRTVADVAAVADPVTGLAVYQTYGGGGWTDMGGTSLASPIIASVYALAGTPRAGDYPSYYPYAGPASLHDVTDGTDTNGSCDPAPAYLCAAGPGYDGPTGLGTPDGVDAFRSSTAHGELVGTVTDSASGRPVANAAVVEGASKTRTDAAGRFVITDAAGTVDLHVSAFGYADRTVTRTITDARSTAFAMTLTARPTVTLSGTVTDGSGEGYPLYAAVSAPGTPLGAVHTNPYTGVFHLQVPTKASFTLHVAARARGYQPTDTQVAVGGQALTHDVRVPVDPASCSADGYQVHFAGLPAEPFEGTAAPAGWAIENNTANGGWEFDRGSVIPRTNETGGTGNFALVDTQLQDRKETVLTSPVVDLSQVPDPSVGLDTQYVGYNGGQFARIDVSTDGGGSWVPVWRRDDDPYLVTGRLVVPLPQAANQPRVQVRFSYLGQYGRYWELDNVWLGKRTCDPVAGGLIAGRVVDLTTKRGVDGVTVTEPAHPDEHTTTQATPDDPAVGDGYFSLFAPGHGTTALQLQARSYQTVRDTVRTRTGQTVRATLPMAAGHLKLSVRSLSRTIALGRQTTATVTVTNRGSAPAKLSVVEQPGGFAATDAGGASPAAAPARQRVRTSVSATSRRSPGLRAATAPAAPAAGSPDWIPVADYPSGPIMDDAAARAADGKVYVVGGTPDGFGPTAAAYVYDPVRLLWTRLPDLPVPVQQPSAAFVGDRLVVAGGWGSTDAVADVQIYDPATGSWTAGTPMPAARAAAGTAVQGGRLYVVGGCTSGDCPYGATTVFGYDAATDSWTSAPDYPAHDAFPSCGGGLSGLVVCAGGFDPETGAGSAKTYAYSPNRGEWVAKADLPISLWGSATAAAGGMLLMSGGVAGDTDLTNEGFAFDAATDEWSPLPNAARPFYRGAGTCGMFRMGGATGQFEAQPFDAELPGYNLCGPSGDVPWLSSATTTMRLSPGESRSVVVRLSAATAREADQPGTYTAGLALQSDTPDGVLVLPVSMTVTPPASWAQVTGAVSAHTCDGPTVALAGATVSFQNAAGTATVSTDADGRYARWVDPGSSGRVRLVVAAAHYTPVVKNVALAGGAVVIRNVTLQPAAC